MFGVDVHNKIYFWSIILLTISLPLSVFVMSVSQFILLTNWIIEGDFRRKWSVLKKRKSLWAFFLIILIHFLGLFYTFDYQTGFHDIQIKIPLLIVPLIVGTSKQLDIFSIKKIMLFFSGAVLLSSLISVGLLYNFTPALTLYKIVKHKQFVLTNIRDISIFIAHIRLSLLVLTSIASLIYFSFISEIKGNFIHRLISLILVFWFACFLVILSSFTGLVILSIISIITGVYLLANIINVKIRYLSLFLLTLFFATIIVYVFGIYSEFYDVKSIKTETIEKYTKEGNPYVNNFDSELLENANFVNIYVCEKELKREWNKLSSIKYNDLDKNGFKTKYTLLRYLTSRSYRKDAEGVKKLNKQDIFNIENSICNYKYNDTSLRTKIYALIWEIDVYKKKGNPSGHSTTQRIEFLKVAKEIIKDNSLLGVGTGDLQQEFDKEYIKTNSQLSKRWRLRAHNQFVSFILAFGFVGFVFIIFALLYPVFYEKKWKSYLFLVFFTIAILSMLNEDTLETQAGVTFFILFYTLFVFSYKTPKSIRLE